MRRKRKDGFSFDFSSLSFERPEDDQARETPRYSLTPVMFDNALELAKQIDYNKDYFCFISGAFIFGDFIEALLYEKRLAPDKIYITTLGMSRENIDSLVNLTRYLRCKQLNLLISNYYAGVERHNNVPYMEQEFAGEPIDVAVLASHCKISIIRSHKGDILISGSANLSSSANVEQFTITHDPDIINFVEHKLDGIFERFTVYRGKDEKPKASSIKGNTGQKAWEALTNGKRLRLG